MEIWNIYCVGNEMVEVIIDKIGSLGDGMGMLNGQPVFVPGTIDGETVDASGEPPRFELEKVISNSPHRIDPTCQHFGVCGGCLLQHVSSKHVLDWKRQEVELAFSRARIDVKVEPTIGCEIGSRRRVTFTAKRISTNVVLGFKQRGSDELVAIEQCPILLPVLENNLSTFADLAKILIRGSEEIQLAINACDNGLDLNFALEQAPTEDMIAALVRAVAKTGFLRASINGDIVIEREKPVVAFGEAQVEIPPGGFLQAVAEAENAMAKLVSKHLKRSKKIVDLFSGSGTFSLRLARTAQVHTVEMEAAALSGLNSANGADGLRAISTEVRDLYDLPLMASELKRFDGICLDPPRAGAMDQVKQIAKTETRAVAYVSCNPTSLAQDAAILIKGGYKLESIHPIDQFVFSPHIEVVALFSKQAEKAKRSIFR